MAAADLTDDRVLALFDGAGPVETPAPGVKAWLANDPADARRPVLIKRLIAGQGKGRATEALTLHHDNIVRTRRWLADGGSLYVVRDIIRGKNLRQSIAATAGIDLDQMRAYFLPVLDALDFAHGRGIAHGGLSPENIIVAADDGRVLISDFGTADPRATHHFQAYNGVANAAGDIRALRRLIATYLPTRGAFASPMVRGRLEGVLARSESLADLRGTIESLDKLAATSGPRPSVVPEDLVPLSSPPGSAPPRLPTLDSAAGEPRLSTAPQLSTQLTERTPFILPGGGGAATLLLRNEGSAPLIVRMVATQHAWLNVRPLELPLTIAAGKSARVEFVISAARLTPGEYRSEVFLSANASGRAAEDLRGGWFKHTAEVRVTIGGPGVGAPPTVQAPGLVYPEDAPKVPAVAGCGPAALLVFLVPTLIIVETWLHAAFAAPMPVK